jgi:hypothetical protein
MKQPTTSYQPNTICMGILVELENQHVTQEMFISGNLLCRKDCIISFVIALIHLKALEA